MEIEQKANKVIRPASIYTLSAEETNQITTELQNVITAGGLTPSNSTLTQVRDAIDNLISDATTGEWQNPADWVDIKSGALPNSIYFLVGHAADYSKYPEFQIKATISNSGTYDVYIDGVKQFTTASNTTTTINWQTLALASGYDTTYPETLRTHIIRLTPSISTNTITAIQTEGTDVQLGLLWAHLQLSNNIGLNYFLGNSNGSKYCPICEAVTSVDDVISLTNANINYAFRKALSLQKIPVLNGNNNQPEASACFMDSSKIKKIILKNIKIYGSSTFRNLSLLEKIECENAFVQLCESSYRECKKLKTIPPTKNVSNLNFVKYIVDALYGCSSLNPTFLDFTEYNNKTRIMLGGTSSVPLNVKGMVVSNEAPFDGASPQINISYTGLDRNALVNLFNSMPTVSAKPSLQHYRRNRCGRFDRRRFSYCNK